MTGLLVCLRQQLTTTTCVRVFTWKRGVVTWAPLASLAKWSALIKLSPLLSQLEFWTLMARWLSYHLKIRTPVGESALRWIYSIKTLYLHCTLLPVLKHSSLALMSKRIIRFLRRRNSKSISQKKGSRKRPRFKKSCHSISIFQHTWKGPRRISSRDEQSLSTTTVVFLPTQITWTWSRRVTNQSFKRKGWSKKNGASWIWTLGLAATRMTGRDSTDSSRKSKV